MHPLTHSQLAIRFDLHAEHGPNVDVVQFSAASKMVGGKEKASLKSHRGVRVVTADGQLWTVASVEKLSKAGHGFSLDGLQWNLAVKYVPAVRLTFAELQAMLMRSLDHCLREVYPSKDAAVRADAMRQASEAQTFEALLAVLRDYLLVIEDEPVTEIAPKSALPFFIRTALLVFAITTAGAAIMQGRDGWHSCAASTSAAGFAGPQHAATERHRLRSSTPNTAAPSAGDSAPM